MPSNESETPKREFIQSGDNVGVTIATEDSRITFRDFFAPGYEIVMYLNTPTYKGALYFTAEEFAELTTVVEYLNLPRTLMDGEQTDD